MDKQQMIDKMVECRKLADEALGIAYDMDDSDIRYRAGLVLDEIDDFLNYLEDSGDD